MEEDTLIYLQLHKLSSIKSEEDLEHILTTLWKTRKTGLSNPEKSHVQSLLNLPSIPEVDPVLACLRLLIRKCVHENFAGDDILKVFPPELSFDLRSILIMLFQKHQNQWKVEISRDQNLLPRTGFSHQVNAGVLSSSDISASLWPRQDDPVAHFSRNNLGASPPIIAETNVSRLAPIPLQCDDGPPDNLGILPRLKSMTWTLENLNTTNNRVAIVSLKLQDYTKSPLGETEVKFQLTRDTLEAMLRSMTYISEQLSLVGSSSGPSQKKQRQ
ncbi:uncharacterized protein LOC132313473 isoform X2 [Cornus florida]|uniref:uncharacterized protein LOC132313473 isoform X2 n=1 Tax=Cornus florida TaxID=4283 RepID=UPI0028A1D98F|nr:uncharacterized protein LOC132313473 isoform X2 [Cornus florida]